MNKQEDKRRFMKKWNEGIIMYKAGIHPNQAKITRALREYLLKYAMN